MWCRKWRGGNRRVEEVGEEETGTGGVWLVIGAKWTADEPECFTTRSEQFALSPSRCLSLSLCVDLSLFSTFLSSSLVLSTVYSSGILSISIYQSWGSFSA